MLGAQVATALLQFGYAAVTSRLVPDTGFGVFAVAMSLSALVTLFARGGLGEASARTPEVQPGKLSFLVLVALALGIAAGLLLLLLAGPWAMLWSAPDAVNPARLVAVTAFMAPVTGLLLGVQRRLGGFRSIAISMVATSAIGMALGVFAVILVPGPMSLLVSPVAAAVLLACVSLFLTRRHWWAKPDAVAARADLGFAWRVLGLMMLAYFSMNVGKWSVSRWVGTFALGQWNRAEVLTAVPLDQGTRALTQAVYPEFRHDIGIQSRTRQVWTDYLLLLAWTCFPAAAILAGAASAAITVLFGPGWELATMIAPLVAIHYGIVAVENALASALESIGEFRLRVWTALASLAVIAAGAAVTKVTGLWAVAPVALIAASTLQHFLQVVFTVRLGALNGWPLARGYVSSLATSAVMGIAAALTSAGVTGRVGPVAMVAGAATLVVFVAIATAKWRQLPPVRILARYRPNVDASG